MTDAELDRLRRIEALSREVVTHWTALNGVRARQIGDASAEVAVALGDLAAEHGLRPSWVRGEWRGIPGRA